MTSWFAQALAGSRVWAVDVVDERQTQDGFEFRLVSGTDTEFDDRSFDLIVSNHVIEHVGSGEDQFAHLTEIRRREEQHADGFPGVLCHNPSPTPV